MRPLLLIAMLLSVSVPAAAQDVVDVMAEEGRVAVFGQMKSLCSEEWPTDFVMQEYCLGKQESGYEKVQVFDMEGSTERTIIGANCSTEWTDDEDRTDWVMMDYCVDQQAAALERLQAR